MNTIFVTFLLYHSLGSKHYLIQIKFSFSEHGIVLIKDMHFILLICSILDSLQLFTATDETETLYDTMYMVVSAPVYELLSGPIHMKV